MNEAKTAMISLLKRLPNYAKLVYLLYNDKNVSVRSKAILTVALGYNISPIDLIPGIIPLAGQLDNMIVILSCLKKALATIDKETVRKHLLAANVTMADIENDSIRSKEVLKLMGAVAVSKTMRGIGAAGRTAGKLIKGLKPRNGKSL